MSDTESETRSVSTDGTLEILDISKVLSSLDDAAQDAKASGDFLSFSTVLDMYYSEPARYSVDEREALLQFLLDSLGKDHLLIEEVGWDLPSLILPFVDAGATKLIKPIRKAPCVYKVIKVFELLALYGNAKELFLKSTELLGSIKCADTDADPEFAFQFYDIKLYCIVELINSTMRRIHTLYPSRFLAMAASSFINSLYINPVTDGDNTRFILKNLYGFCRHYEAPPRPKALDISHHESEKLLSDENYLQRKLLTALLTEGVHLTLRLKPFGLAISFFNGINKNSPTKRMISDFELDLPIAERLNELALSFDLDPIQDFADFATSSEKLIDFEGARKQTEEAFNVNLFKNLTADFDREFGHSIVDKSATSVRNSLSGSLLLLSYIVCSDDHPADYDITISQAISLTLRLLIPTLVNPNLLHRGLQDMSLFWCWYAISKVASSSPRTKTLESELAAIPKVVLMTFMQCLAFQIISFTSESMYRYVTLTLLSRILSSVPEDVSYQFIIDSLRECPFESVKAALVGILRVLSTSDRKINDVSHSLNSLNLGSLPSTKEVETKQTSPPPLPVRETEVSKGSKFINLDQQAVKEILTLTDGYIESTFAASKDGPQVNLELFSTLQALLNLLIPLKRWGKLEPRELDKVVKRTAEHISKFEESRKGDDCQINIVNAVGVLRVTLARLTE